MSALNHDRYAMAVLCPTCKSDADDGDEVMTARCVDCGVESCCHELEAVRRTQLGGRTEMQLACKHRGGCIRRREGRSVSSRDAAHEDDGRSDDERDRAIDKSMERG